MSVLKCAKAADLSSGNEAVLSCFIIPGQSRYAPSGSASVPQRFRGAIDHVVVSSPGRLTPSIQSVPMRSIISFCLTAALSACAAPAADSKSPATASVTAPADSAARDSTAHRAHENYVRVINSNNIDSLTSMFTDDVIFLAANSKPIVGKAAVREWADGYYKAYHAHWDKPVQEFSVSGDYAVERYNYTSTDTPVGGGKDEVDTGWGLVVYHREPDGTWRVTRDAFGPDHPPAK